jgi:hypothetical protein
MSGEEPRVDVLLRTLQERAKELSCLYRVDEALHEWSGPLEGVLRRVVEALPPGWQHPAICEARVRVGDVEVHTAGFRETPWVQAAPVTAGGRPLGVVEVRYTEPASEADEGPFLKEERKLLDTVAERIAQTVCHRELAVVFGEEGIPAVTGRHDWTVVVDLLRRTDLTLFRQVARKMLNALSFAGVPEAQRLLARLSAPGGGLPDDNRPTDRPSPRDPDEVAEETFRLAARHLGEDELLARVQAWVKEDRVNFLLSALESADTSLPDIAAALERYQHTGVDVRQLSAATQSGLKVSLIRRLLTEQRDFIETCRRFVEIEDFYALLDRTILLPRSHGRLGGKGSGLFLAAHVLGAGGGAAVEGVRIPRTWYLPSDGLLAFMAHNDLGDVFNWKYRDIDQIRQEYPHLLQVFKSSRFPPEVVHGLSMALDDLGDRPLIVRSSSLLEDRAGAAFSGKYKSLFLANQGTKPERLLALQDAIAEVYASVFGPDPIQYRAERGLLEHHEEMAVMVQEVVGTRVGRYFLPVWSGVAFSHNELLWSPRIRREDGLLRLVPGLGTRAVDRLSDDYPILAAPGQPGLRVNVTPEEVWRYSPRRVDVIDLEANSFRTVDGRELLREVGGALPGLADLVSVREHDRLRRPSLDGLSLERTEDLVFTFEGLLAGTPFVPRIRALLDVLSRALGTPVDLEFACDGRDLYLVQCRPQSHAPDAAPAAIPRDLPRERVLFSAHRHVPNGTVGGLTHLVYVDPEAYGRLPDLQALRDVGRAVGRLNKILPKRQFVLIGPGRWGSRGDVRLGVSVTYADINNTAALVEVARKRGHYVPDLSFGTHFFQDLVESSIRYLPLYPDEPGVVFDDAFFRGENLLPALLPEFAHLADVVRVIDVPRAAGGQVLRILMNADLGEAVAVFAPPEEREDATPVTAAPAARPGDDHSRWRLRMVEELAASLDAGRFGVRAVYVFGSTKNGTAGPASDVDLIVHVDGTRPRDDLQGWLEGWSRALAAANYVRTGRRRAGLLDVQLVSDEDVAQGTGYAAKIGAVTDAARPLALRS